MSFLEAVNQPRTIDQPFMLVDIRLGSDGKGEGKLMPASEPVRLTEVHDVT